MHIRIQLQISLDARYRHSDRDELFLRDSRQIDASMNFSTKSTESGDLSKIRAPVR